LTGFYQSVVVIDKAAIPLLKLVEAGSGMHIGSHLLCCCLVIVCLDVSFNVQSFYAVCDWVEKMRTECKFLHPLVLVLKQFLSVNNLNSPFNGGLPSYALVVMVAHFLKVILLPTIINLFAI
jgi:DNA polymerase sigma